MSTNAATHAWDDLAQRLDRFVAAWESGQPRLAEFLPLEPASLRRMVLTELIKVDLELRASSGTFQQLEHYCREFPELLEDGEPPCDLIYEEFHVRRGLGETIAPRDYFDRFPRSAAALKRLLGSQPTSATTALFPARRLEGFDAGQRLDDFELLVQLGKGAFGCVFLARQLSMQRLVALKISADKGSEPQTLAQLDHPNIVRVFDQRQLPDRKLRLLYMQYAPGGTLHEVLDLAKQTPDHARTGKLLVTAVGESLARGGLLVGEDSHWKRRTASQSWAETVCRIGSQLALALDYAHKQGVLHRDVKPANVLLSADAVPKLADFNISFSSQLDGATPAAYFGGSLAYMSPEQLEACNPTHSRDPAELDGRSDLYSLAVMLWELLYGERPFRDGHLQGGWTATLVDMTEIRRSSPPSRPESLDIIDPLKFRIERVLTRVLAPDPASRPADGSALARDLMLCLNPRAWDLLHELGSGWRSFIRNRPMISLILVNFPPFAIAGAFNYWFNYVEVIRPNPELEEPFFKVQLVLNSFFYPLGLTLGTFFSWRVASAVKLVAKGHDITDDYSITARRQALWLGHVIAWIGMLEWIAAGIAFPVGLHLFSDSFPRSAWVHFFLSQTTCGLVSAGLPFLATSWLAIRVFYPTLLGQHPPDATDQKQLSRLLRHSNISLLTAGVVPLLGLFMFAVSGLNNQLASIIFIVASVAALLAAYAIHQRIRSDLAALSVATRPIDSFGANTDTVDVM